MLLCLISRKDRSLLRICLSLVHVESAILRASRVSEPPASAGGEWRTSPRLRGRLAANGYQADRAILLHALEPAGQCADDAAAGFDSHFRLHGHEKGIGAGFLDDDA